MHDVVELRSDTFTLPSPAMREAMARADVGDDVWEEDPTVQRLEALAARRTGKEAGLFVASGTQCNLVLHPRADRAGPESSSTPTATSSARRFGGAARLVGCRPAPWSPSAASSLPLRSASRPARQYPPARTGLVCIENTHNRHGGTCCTPEEIAAVSRPHTGRRAGAPDGARIFNAASRSAPVGRLHPPGGLPDFCLSKGLGAPVGSLICGRRDFIARARRVRKMIGGECGRRRARRGGDRVPGNLVERAGGGSSPRAPARRRPDTLPGLSVDLATVETNSVRFQVTAPSAPPTRDRLPRPKVKLHHAGPGDPLRHPQDVDGEDIDRALDAFREITAPWR